MEASFLIGMTRVFLTISLAVTSLFFHTNTAVANPLPPKPDDADLRVVTLTCAV